MKALAIWGAAAGTILLASPAKATQLPLMDSQNHFFYVLHIDITGYPSYLEFTLSGGNTDCSGGTALTYQSSNLENMKAAYATLLASALSQRPLYVWYDKSVPSPYGPTACSVVVVLGLA